jgi:cytochrome c oxidase cbb3-type subunit 2
VGVSIAGLSRGAGRSLSAAVLAGAFAWQTVVPVVDGSPPAPVSAEVLRRGRLVYEANCAVCHGVTGDGRGPAAHMFRVQPRDFRQGLFKFRSTASGALPTDEDLLRTVTEGLRWTAMVGRPDLPEGDRRAVVAHVKTFSPRFSREPAPSPIGVPPAPARSPDLLEAGRRLYRDAECAACHGDHGRGDGPSAAAMTDDWGWATRPGDLTWRPLKRGSSAADIYLSIATGLAGTPMPAYGDALEGREIWALVDYLESLVPPDQRRSPLGVLGEEPRGWMALRMGRMMGGPMGPGMMRRMPGVPP